MTEDLQTEASNAEGYAGWDVDDVLMIVGVAVIGAVALAFWLYSRSIGQIGVGLVSSFTSPISAGFNGFASLITSFFSWASHAVTALFILPWLSHAMVMFAAARAYVSLSLAVRLHLSVFTNSGYAAMNLLGM